RRRPRLSIEPTADAFVDARPRPARHPRACGDRARNPRHRLGPRTGHEDRRPDPADARTEGSERIMSIRILLADDHTLMRQGLRHILEGHPDFDIVAEASSGIEAVEAAREHRPDVAIVDVAMKELNGIEATSQILKNSPHTAVVMLSMYSD